MVAIVQVLFYASLRISTPFQFGATTSGFRVSGCVSENRDVRRDVASTRKKSGDTVPITYLVKGRKIQDWLW